MVGMIIDQEYNKARILRCQWKVVSRNRLPLRKVLLPYMYLLRNPVRVP